MRWQCLTMWRHFFLTFFKSEIAIDLIWIKCSWSESLQRWTQIYTSKLAFVNLVVCLFNFKVNWRDNLYHSLHHIVNKIYTIFRIVLSLVLQQSANVRFFRLYLNFFQKTGNEYNASTWISAFSNSIHSPIARTSQPTLVKIV